MAVRRSCRNGMVQSEQQGLLVMVWLQSVIALGLTADL